MRVLLAGYNYDINSPQQIKTPETLSAAYARISRADKDIDVLRQEACEDVKRARKSNENIIFNLGHSSIAEHAVFNFDLIDVSRLAAEYLQHHRLISFTEKSQRYVKFEKGFIIPEEIKKSEYEKQYIELCNKCFFMYNGILNTNSCFKHIKEDARYVLPLSTYTQMGMTVNGRTLEYMIGKLMSSNLAEINLLANKLLKSVKQLAPSIIKYTDKRDLYTNTKTMAQNNHCENVKLIEYTQNATSKIAAYILFENNGISIKEAYNKIKDINKLKDIYKNIFSKLEMWDKPPRVFEYADYTFEICLSASAFAQLKRHRMSSIIKQNYMFDCNPVIPKSIENTEYNDRILHLHKDIASLARNINKINNEVMHYIALNGTKRKILIKMNAREIYHFTRLRSDNHAQWEIRNISRQIENILKQKEPILFLLLGGKHEFSLLKEKIYEL